MRLEARVMSAGESLRELVLRKRSSWVMILGNAVQDGLPWGSLLTDREGEARWSVLRAMLRNPGILSAQ